METQRIYDAVIVGSGPNGLAAAATLAQAGRSVLIIEGQDTIGGGARSAQLTLPGYIHDTCSAVHPFAVASPFFKNLPLEKHGLRWIDPPAALAHPFDDGSVALLYQSIEATIQTLGDRDGAAYKRLLAPLVKASGHLFEEILAPMLHVPRHPLLLARFGLSAIQSAEGLSRRCFEDPQAQGLFAGLAAHSFLPLSQAGSSAVGLVLAVAAHGQGWPIPQGGSQSISNALASYIQSFGGKILAGTPVRSIKDLPKARTVFFDLVPHTLLKVLDDRLPGGYRRRLERWQYGPGVFKLDWALSGPIPWRMSECAQAGTVHIGGTLEELALSEQAPWDGKPSEKPFVLLSQPSLFDTTRAPPGSHTVWAYCHVPRGSTVDMTEIVENQIERFAPGFRKLILSRSILFPADVEHRNPNFVGGEISGGVPSLRQLLIRPVLRRVPYMIPIPGYYLCSASTPPGPGVHGMCGYLAARAALKKELK